MEYTIGEFTMSKEVDIVPKAWLTKDGQCWWPNYKTSSKVTSAVKQGTQPDPTNFKLYPFRVFRHYSKGLKIDLS